ncbi:DUF4245 domain-containing protein [Actinomycetes bacterium KLBMP 9759]
MSSPEPAPPSKPSRSAMSVRDMLVAIGVLVLIVGALAGVARACTFSPAGPTIDSSRLPVVDTPAELRRLAPVVGFPLRVPALPAGWRANSSGLDRVEGGGKVVRVGFLTPDGRYLRLMQADSTEEALLAVETGPDAVPGQGVVDVGGQQWVRYGTRSEEPIWITEVAADGRPIRMLITGSGNEAEYRELATAAVSGELVR